MRNYECSEWHTLQHILILRIFQQTTNRLIQEYQSVIVFFNLILFMTSGTFYPVSGMPSWLSWITTINPEYYGVHALRSIILRNLGLNVIGTDLIALLIFSTAMIILGVVTYRRTLE